MTYGLSDATYQTCNHKHEFVILPDHPKTDEKYDCPYCMKIQIIQFESYIDFMEQQDEANAKKEKEIHKV